MISLTDAQKIAKEHGQVITSYTEDKTAYIFIDNNTKWDGETVVLKRNGKVLSYTEYILKYKQQEENKLGYLSVKR